QFALQWYKNNSRLNGRFLPDEQLWSVVNERTFSAEGTPLVIRREDFLRLDRVELRSDLKFTSESQRIQEHNQLMDIVFKLPDLAGNMALKYAVLKRAF